MSMDHDPAEAYRQARDALDTSLRLLLWQVSAMPSGDVQAALLETYKRISDALQLVRRTEADAIAALLERKETP